MLRSGQALPASFFGCFLSLEGEGKDGDEAEEGDEFHGK